jgi:hypothetical protein
VVFSYLKYPKLNFFRSDHFYFTTKNPIEQIIMFNGIQLGGDTNLSTPTINTLIVGVLLGGHQTTPILADMVEFNSLQSTYNNLPVTKSN